jgi:hypothetical protein
VVAVHYGGQPADMDELGAVAAETGAVLLEDAAEAHGARYRGRPVGGPGRAAMFSFTPTKNITTGEGGMITTGDGDLACSLRLLRNHGQTARYQHDSLGWNWRLSEMQAAIGRFQLAAHRQRPRRDLRCDASPPRSPPLITPRPGPPDRATNSHGSPPRRLDPELIWYRESWSPLRRAAELAKLLENTFRHVNIT